MRSSQHGQRLPNGTGRPPTRSSNSDMKITLRIFLRLSGLTAVPAMAKRTDADGAIGVVKRPPMQRIPGASIQKRRRLGEYGEGGKGKEVNGTRDLSHAVIPNQPPRWAFNENCLCESGVVSTLDGPRSRVWRHWRLGRPNAQA
jgi:hypothetical protein